MADPSAPGLSRTLSRWSLAIYGLGTILGAGIYVVVGKVAGHAGALAPFAFLIAAIAAGFTGFSYAELSGRVPESGGSAAFIARGFSRKALTTIAGWALIATGLVSAATITTGFVGYMGVFIEVSPLFAIPLAVGMITFVAAIGVKEAVWLMILTTALEVSGLVIVMVFAGPAIADYPARFADALEAGASLQLAGGVMLASVLAFYAFIGFEDLATLSEEVQDTSRDIPFAIVWALASSLIFYVVISAIAVSALDPAALGESEAPLADVVAAHGGPDGLLAAISLATILNGALAQIVMASRVIHDLGSRRGGAPAWLAAINPRTHTPLYASMLCGIVIAALALFFPTEALAAGTSILILLIFAAACIALMVMKRRGDAVPDGCRTVPAWVPALGAGSCLVLVCAQIALTITGQ